MTSNSIDPLTMALMACADPKLSPGNVIRAQRDVEALTPDGKFRLALVGYNRAAELRPHEKVLHREIVGWRMYWLHRGRLCPALVGSLEPVPRVSFAACPPPLGPVFNPDAFNSRNCPAEQIPGPDCLCGLRVCDTVDALRSIAHGMCLKPGTTPPIINAYAAAHAASGVEPEDWDIPVPALVRVRCTDALQDDRGFRCTRFLETNPAGQYLLSSSKWPGRFRPGECLAEYEGTYRARRLEIIGPVLTGPVPLGTPDVRDLEQHYRIRYADATDLTDRSHDDDGHPIGFGHVFRMAADGRLPRKLMKERRTPNRKATTP